MTKLSYSKLEKERPIIQKKTRNNDSVEKIYKGNSKFNQQSKHTME